MASCRMIQNVRRFSTSRVVNKLVASPAQVFGIEGRYAHALYSAATKENKLDVVDKEMKQLQDLMKKDAKLSAYISNPTYKKTAKKVALEAALTKQKYSGLTVNLFCALAENGRLKKVPAVLRSFDTIMRAHRGEVTCTITTAKPLDGSEEKQLTDALQGFLAKGQSLMIEKKIDPSIIGGMIVNLGDRYVDMSMVAKIATYTNLIKQAI